MKFRNLPLFVMLLIAVAACSGSDTASPNEASVSSSDATASSGGDSFATLTVGAETHEFPEPMCLTGFSNDLLAVVANDEVRFEASQLEPSRNTWVIAYAAVLADQEFDQYQTLEHETNRSENRIIGTATVENAPGESIDISYDIVCADK